MREIFSKSLENTKEIAENLLFELEKSKFKNDTVILSLYGNLGSGKTTFCQILGRLLGVKETMQSPTFLIQKTYDTKHPRFKKFVHIDAYRIDDTNEMKVLGFQELIQKPNQVIAVEWPERIEKLIPKSTKKIFFEFIDEDTRRIAL